MRKIITLAFLVTILLFLVSCAQISEIDSLVNPYAQNEYSTKAFAERTFIDSFCFIATENDVRSFVKAHQPLQQICSFKPIERDGDSLLFVVNYDNGWAVFSSDKHLPPIVAENAEGSFDLNTLDNPGVRGWMREIMDVISAIRQETSTDTANENTNLWEGRPVTREKASNEEVVRTYTWTKIPISQVVQGDSIETYGPYLPTKWGQRSPWNNHLPIYSGNTRYATGCVAVAVSQLLYYYHNVIGAPSGLYHNITITDWTYHSATPDTTAHYTSTLSRENYTNNSSRWDQMILDQTEYSIFSPLSIIGAGYVSDLMVDVGNRVQMRYEADGSGATSDILKAQAALPYYGLDGTFGYFNSSPVVANLKQARPLYMTGYDTVLDDGHAWVVDGLKLHRQIIQTTYEWIQGYMPGEYPTGEPATQEEANDAALAEGYDKPENGMITHVNSISLPYGYGYHMNWGQNGDFDGFYYGINSITVGNYHFTSNQQVLYNIH